MNKIKRNYQNDYPSVTQIIDMWRKPELEMWFKFNTLEFINEESNKAKAIGTTLHEAIQAHIDNTDAEIQTDYPDEVKITIQSFLLFRKEHPEIKLSRSEIQLTSEKWHYNGTIDVKETRNFIGDWKTGKCGHKKNGEIVYDDKPKIYESHIIQIAAYKNLWEEKEKISLDGGWIAVFAKDKVAYNFQVFERRELVQYFRYCFLTALEKYKFMEVGKIKRG